MNIQIYGKNIEVTPAIDSYIRNKITKLEKFFHEPHKARIEVSVDKHHKHGLVHQVDINIFLGHEVLRAVERYETIYSAVDEAYEDLKKQALRDKEKYHSKKRKIIQMKRFMKSIWPWQWFNKE